MKKLFMFAAAGTLAGMFALAIATAVIIDAVEGGIQEFGDAVF